MRCFRCRFENGQIYATLIGTLNMGRRGSSRCFQAARASRRIPAVPYSVSSAGWRLLTGCPVDTDSCPEVPIGLLEVNPQNAAFSSNSQRTEPPGRTSFAQGTVLSSTSHPVFDEPRTAESGTTTVISGGRRSAFARLLETAHPGHWSYGAVELLEVKISMDS